MLLCHTIHLLMGHFYYLLQFNKAVHWDHNLVMQTVDNLAAVCLTSDLHLISWRFNYNQLGEH